MENIASRKGLIARKLMMHQLITEQGDFIPVTYLQVEPNVVIQVKTEEKDGYQALQIGAPRPTDKHTKQAQKKQFKKAKIPGAWIVREIRDMSGFEVADRLDGSIFKVGSFIDVRGLTKGKGMAGVIKRFGFSRGPMSHGSHHHRRPGSIGFSGAERVWKGKKMAGRMGGKNRTIQNIEIVQFLKEENLLVVRGSLPGPNRSWLVLTNSRKMKPDLKEPTKLFHYRPAETVDSKPKKELKTEPVKEKTKASNQNVEKPKDIKEDKK